jgi:hypothetical protein
VQCFPRYWSKAKCSLIAGTIARHIKEHRPDRVALKMPTEVRPSKHLRLLSCMLQRQLTRQQLPLFCYTLHDLKECFGCKSRDMLIEALAGQYPELTHTYQKVLRYRNGYYNKMFEAIASAMLCEAVSQK